MAKQHNKRKTAPKKKPQLQTPDLWGNYVTCPADHWQEHIIQEEGRTFLIGREQEIEKVIRDPDQVRPSTKTGKAFAFESATPADVLRVIVYYDAPTLVQSGRTRGTVATVYEDDPIFTSQVGAPIYQKQPGTPADLKPLGVKKK